MASTATAPADVRKPPDERDPAKVNAGRIGARRRWGAPRIVRLDELDPRVAAAVRALIDADTAARAAEKAVDDAA